jgi:predicted dehydrogenase
MPEPVRVAIVGTGNIARVHAEALAAVNSDAIAPLATIVAVMDTDDRRLGSFMEELAVPAGYRQLDDLLSHEHPDLVHICTPPSAHYPVALGCLRAGVSVLVEKPPAISLREFDALAAAESEEGGHRAPPWFATVFQHRFGSGQRRLATLAASGVLGRPLLALCHTTWFRDQAYFDVEWRGRWDTEGGGPTMGHGIHQMDMLLDVLGEWTEVSAIARTQARKTSTEDLSLAHVTFASGAVASVVNSVLSPREESYLRFDFERATIEVTHLYGYDDDDWRVTPAPGSDEEVLAAWAQAAGGAARAAGAASAARAAGAADAASSAGSAGSGGVSAARTGRSGHAAQFAHVLAALRDRRRPPVGPAQARGTLSLAAGIYASAFARRPVTPDYLAPGTPFYQRMNGPMDGGTTA